MYDLFPGLKFWRCINFFSMHFLYVQRARLSIVFETKTEAEKPAQQSSLNLAHSWLMELLQSSLWSSGYWDSDGSQRSVRPSGGNLVVKCTCKLQLRVGSLLNVFFFDAFDSNSAEILRPEYYFSILPTLSNRLILSYFCQLSAW